jgi:hypothetical protein
MHTPELVEHERPKSPQQRSLIYGTRQIESDIGCRPAREGAPEHAEAKSFEDKTREETEALATFQNLSHDRHRMLRLGEEYQPFTRLKYGPVPEGIQLEPGDLP